MNSGFLKMEILYDDVGSFPLPPSVSKEKVSEAISAGRNDQELYSVIEQVFLMKQDAGVSIPTYPQFQDMITQFTDVFLNPDCCTEPYRVRMECTNMVELEALEIPGKRYFEETGEKMPVRVCLTGPIELYLNQFGSAVYEDIFKIFAQNINLYCRNAIKNSKYIDIKTLSIDEPSLGLNPDLSLTRDELIDGLTISGRAAAKNGLDVQIHIHSPLYYDIACETATINVIGVESAATPSYIEMIDKNVLESTDTFLRIGISRTDIFNLVGILNEKYNTNAWNSPNTLNKILTEIETPDVIEKRLNYFYSIFGDTIRYVGPDCGLGSWPSQELAYGLLKNTGTAIESFCNKI